MKMVNSSIFLLLVFTFLFTKGLAVPAAVEDMGFSDVNEEDWYAEAVMYCRNNDIMTGVTDTEFLPLANVNRATLATILWRMDGGEVTGNSFTLADVEEGTWYSDAVGWAVQAEVASGYSGTVFGVNDPVTWEQAITMLYRYEIYQNGHPEVTGGSFSSDINGVADWAIEAVAWAQENAIATKKAETAFEPKGSINRGEAAVMLYQYMTKDLTANAQQPITANGKILVAYFSHTGNTEILAEHVQEITGGDLFKIVPLKEYPDNYEECLVQAANELEQGFRPELASHIENMDEYSVVFIGYPIWHGNMPMVVRSFLEEYDLAGKAVVPFCTFGSSGFSSSIAAITGVSPGAHILEGFHVEGAGVGSARSNVQYWISRLNLENYMGQNEDAPLAEEISQSSVQPTSEAILNLQIGEQVLTATLVENSSTQALKELLTEGPVTIEMQDYGNFEKVGSLGRSLPANDERITTEPGDLILYQGSSFVIYYASNTWSFTRLGKINDITQNELKEILGSGNVKVTLSLKQD